MIKRWLIVSLLTYTLSFNCFAENPCLTQITHTCVSANELECQNHPSSLCYFCEIYKTYPPEQILSHSRKCLVLFKAPFATKCHWQNQQISEVTCKIGLHHSPHIQIKRSDQLLLPLLAQLKKSNLKKPLTAKLNTEMINLMFQICIQDAKHYIKHHKTKHQLSYFQQVEMQMELKKNCRCFAQFPGLITAIKHLASQLPQVSMDALDQHGKPLWRQFHKAKAYCFDKEWE